MVHFGSADKGVKTQTEAPEEKHHSSLRDSSGTVSSVKDAINQPISPAPADLIYMFARGINHLKECGENAQFSSADRPSAPDEQPQENR